MGTHPIFESDFDCLTETKKMITAKLLQRTLVTSAARANFKASDLIVEKSSNLKAKPENPETVGFTDGFTDHMLEIDFDALKGGWGKPKIRPFGPLSLHPASSALHYAVELFEGMKAYRTDNSEVVMFRPDANIARMHKSALRSALPSFDQKEMLECIRALIDIDREWVPDQSDASLYIRPCLIGTEETLGPKPPTKAKCFVIMFPIGTSQSEPISLLADPSVVRACPGGVGSHKLGANYGPTFHPQMKAKEQGYHNLLWLYGPEHLITEIGTMNIMIWWRRKDGKMELL